VRKMDIKQELDLARSSVGKLEPDIRKSLQKVVDNPTEENWEDALEIIIGADRRMTLWEAVVALDPSYADMWPVETWDEKTSRTIRIRGWKKIPTRRLLTAALRYATH